MSSLLKNPDLTGKTVYLVGIKGTGMAALAALLQSRGAQVSGSDVEDRFFTDESLQALRIPVHQGFSVKNLPNTADLVVYSAAYNPEIHEELKEIVRRGWPLEVYTQALGDFSAAAWSAGVAGVHGKTTTTSLCGMILRSLEMPFSLVVGSTVPAFGGQGVLTLGKEFFVAETCEYRRHFLTFHPQAILVTSIEADHLDYFKDGEDVFQAFLEYAHRLPEGGTLVYCADDSGAQRLAVEVAHQRPDILLIPYGFQAEGDYKIVKSFHTSGYNHFYLDGFFPEFTLQVPGKHNVVNAAGALALSMVMYKSWGKEVDSIALVHMAEALGQFTGSKRRSEILGETKGVLFMDDYAHHPTAIETTLQGFREFWPQRRLVVSFMSHTYSRTKALLKEFSTSFGAADLVILHEIYASAREAFDPEITGEIFYEETKKHHKNVKYFPDFSTSGKQICELLRPGDLFVTMGAGDNWKLGLELRSLWEGKI